MDGETCDAGNVEPDVLDGVRFHASGEDFGGLAGGGLEYAGGEFVRYSVRPFVAALVAVERRAVAVVAAGDGGDDASVVVVMCGGAAAVKK